MRFQVFAAFVGFAALPNVLGSSLSARRVTNVNPEGVPASWNKKNFKPEAVTVTWDYDRSDAVNGPSGWTTLASGSPNCGLTSQSPININFSPYSKVALSSASPSSYAVHDATLTPLSVNWNTYSAATTIVENNGHAIEVLPSSTDLSSTFTGGALTDIYSMTQFHFHYISEHTVNGASYAAELHIVGTTENAADLNGGPSNTAVLGIFFEEDPNPTAAPNAGLTAILNAAQAGTLTTLGNSAPVSLSLASFWNTSSTNDFFTYPGSLTTPPCTQDVIWTVLKQPLLIPGTQLQALRQLLGITSLIGPFTNRPTQPLNSRTIRTSVQLLATPATPTLAPSSGPVLTPVGPLTALFATSPPVGVTAASSIAITTASGSPVSATPSIPAPPTTAATNNYLISVPNAVTQVNFDVITNVYTAQIQYRWFPNYPSPALLFPTATGLSAASYTCDPCAGGTAVSCNTATGPGATPSPAGGFVCASLARQYCFSNLVVGTNSFSLQLFDNNQNPAPDTSSYSFTVVRGAVAVIVGDPQIIGIQGQDFQVHGSPDTVFNLISSSSLQVNALFIYRSSGVCQDNFTACFAHPGTYIGAVGIMVGSPSSPSRVRISAGSVRRGLRVSVNGASVDLDAGKIMEVGEDRDGSSTLNVVSYRRVVLVTPHARITFDNSDHFLNQQIEINDQALKQAGQKRVVLRDGESYPIPEDVKRKNMMHGLQGQTWKNAEYPSGLEYEGSIMDYQITDGNLFGTDFVFNLFK